MGLSTPNVPLLSTATELLGNGETGTGRVPVNALATQLAGAGPIAAALADKDTRLVAAQSAIQDTTSQVALLSPRISTLEQTAQSLATGFRQIDAVRALSTVAVALNTIANGSVLGGVALATGDRFAVVAQAAGAANGVYVTPAAAGTATRAQDADAAAEMQGATFYVREGAAKGQEWRCNTPAPITLGTTALTFVLNDETNTTGLADATVTATSYSNLGGQGDRRTLINVGTVNPYLPTSPLNLVNGNNTADAANAFSWSTGNAADRLASFNFPRGSSLVVDEIMIRHPQGSSSNQGVWRVVAKRRLEDAGWTVVSADFTLKPPAASGTDDASVKQFVPLSRVYEKGKVKGFDTFAIQGVSGTFTQSSTTRALVEVEFKLGFAADHQNLPAPMGGGASQALVKQSAESGDFAFVDVSEDAQGTGLRSAMHTLQELRVAESVSRARYFLDSGMPDDTMSGENSSFAKKTVAGLFRRTSIPKAGFTKTAGFTNIYQAPIDKGAVKYPKGAVWSISYTTSLTAVASFNMTPCESLEDLDLTPGGFYIEKGLSRVSTVYVNATSSDKNPVTNVQNYIATLTVPKSATLALRGGSVFSDQSIEPPLGYTAIIGMSNSPMPYLDCGSTIPPGSFALSADPLATADGANALVYEVTLTREQIFRTLNSGRWVLFEIDLAGRVWPLQEVASVAAVKARAGTVFFASPTNSSTAANQADTVKVFIQPRFSTNPQSDGKTYRFNNLKAGISIDSNVDAGTSQAFDGIKVEGVKAGYQVSGHGAILGNSDVTFERNLVVQANKHGYVIQSGRMQDCIAFQGAVPPSTDMDYYAFTSYRNQPNYIETFLERCGVVNPDHYPIARAAFYQHGSIDGSSPKRGMLEQFFIYNGGAVSPGATDTTVFLDTLIRCREGALRGYSYASLAALQADVTPPPQDGELASVRSGAVPELGQYRYNAALNPPAWEKTTDAFQGSISLGPGSPTYANRKHIVRRAMIKTGSSSGLIWLGAPTGSIDTPTVPQEISDSVLHHIPAHGALAIQLGRATKFQIFNNIIVAEDGGGYPASLGTSTEGSIFSRNIFYDTRKAGNPAPLWRLNATTAGPLYTEIDYNIYVGCANTNIVLNGATYSIYTKALFETYRAAAAAFNIDQHSIFLTLEDARNLFSGDPMAGDFRLKKGALFYADGSPMAFLDGKPIVGPDGIPNAGPRRHRDWNSRAILPGAPAYWPITPRTEAECELYCRAPWLWDWRTGKSELGSLALAA